MTSEGFAIDDARSGPEIARQGPEIQPVIQIPGTIRNYTDAMSAYVFGKTLLRWVADVETAKIDSYSQGNALFQSAGDGLHETPHGLTQNGLVGVGGGDDEEIIRLAGTCFEGNSKCGRPKAETMILQRY